MTLFFEGRTLYVSILSLTCLSFYTSHPDFDDTIKIKGYRILMYIFVHTLNCFRLLNPK